MSVDRPVNCGWHRHLRGAFPETRRAYHAWLLETARELKDRLNRRRHLETARDVRTTPFNWVRRPWQEIPR